MKKLKLITEDIRKRNAAIAKITAVRDQAAAALPDVSDKLAKLPDHARDLRLLALDVEAGLIDAKTAAQTEARLRAEGLETAKLSAELKAERQRLADTVADCEARIDEQQAIVAGLTADGRDALLAVLKTRLEAANDDYRAAVTVLREKYSAVFALSRAHWHLCGESFSANENLTNSRDCLSGLTLGDGLAELIHDQHGIYSFSASAESGAINDKTTAILQEYQAQFPEVIQ